MQIQIQILSFSMLSLVVLFGAMWEKVRRLERRLKDLESLRIRKGTDHDKEVLTL